MLTAHPQLPNYHRYPGTGRAQKGREKWTRPGLNRTPLAFKCPAEVLSERDNQLHHVPYERV